jgi:hypothetical protein
MPPRSADAKHSGISGLFDMADVLHADVLPVQASLLENYARKLDRGAGLQGIEFMNDLWSSLRQQIPQLATFLGPNQDITSVLQDVRNAHPLLGVFMDELDRSIDETDPATNTELQAQLPASPEDFAGGSERLLAIEKTINSLREAVKDSATTKDLVQSLRNKADTLRALNSPVDALRADEEAIWL